MCMADLNFYNISTQRTSRDLIMVQREIKIDSTISNQLHGSVRNRGGLRKPFSTADMEKHEE